MFSLVEARHRCGIFAENKCRALDEAALAGLSKGNAVQQCDILRDGLLDFGD